MASNAPGAVSDDSLSSPPHSPSPEPLRHASASVHIAPLGINASNSTTTSEPAVKARRKPGRKPRNYVPGPNSPPPKQRKPRRPKDPDAPPVQRKRKSGATPAPEARSSLPSGSFFTDGGKSEVVTSTVPNNASFFDPTAQQQQHAPPYQAPRSSGQNYDPIRSNYDPVRETVVSHNPFSSQVSPQHHNAQKSPSISSLVDPPGHSPSIASQSFFNQQQAARLHQEAQPSPTANRLAPSAVIESPSQPHPQPPTLVSRKSDTMVPGPTPMVKRASLGHGSTATSSTAASPKPPKLKEAKDVYPPPPPLPGSGLMQLGGIGGGPTDGGTEFRAPTVVLHIPMNGESNKVINFTRMAEERYGWDALHPRLAAQRDRLARVAAAGAALERNGSSRDSGDDMSLDSEGEGSNVEMGGMSDGRAGTDSGVKKVVRKRKMKEDDYDKDDGFVDDSELLWEEQAAAADGGFFVYSGPLVPEGEKPALDLRADGAPKRGRGRGSRGGRGGLSRGASAAAAASAANAAAGGVGINAKTGLPLSGPGSRGGSTTRKPRITKADRQRMEQEKLDREKMGTMTPAPAGYNGMAQLASAANMGNTPMVFNQ
ncbi:hypothetical protein GLAREA_02876 [Glarea lozoyensis ATCC 20868]|uniref:Hpc2-related domain-containing protein n=2 Tax=Glarea lozoyensis TaxID=101852 RepID=S3CKB5_GLAL2|nr:uncharacterized protein GLAREA_02876 [Glarea lozoyensis ATCC 20868]EPE26962.1 hypothetical protein GLAREA_02876 [Glarea lozoyensis ATCC 20868]